MSLPEMGRIICLNRDQVYHLLKSTPELEVIVIGDQKRVTIESFNTWYGSSIPCAVREMGIHPRCARFLISEMKAKQ